MQQIPSLIENAKGLVRNPLGVIGLFICFVYAMAVVVVAVPAANLESGQRWLLVAFLVLFPIVVLIAFVWLVTCHHTKLYSPADYRSDDSFLRHMTPQEKRDRIASESSDTKAPAARIDLSNQTTTSSISTPQHEDSTKFLQAEALAFRELESQLGVAVSREMVIQVEGKPKVQLDGVVSSEQFLVGVEVKLLRDGRLADHIAQHVVQSAKRMREVARKLRPTIGCGFIFVPVLEKGDDYTESRIWQQMYSLGSKEGFIIDVRPMWLDTLKRRYLSRIPSTDNAASTGSKTQPLTPRSASAD